jgi:Ser/Thr protein kinase RdoA (MazF antagonist)
MLRRARGSYAALRPSMSRAGMWLQFMQEQTRSHHDGRGALAALLRDARRDLVLAAALDWPVRKAFGVIADRLDSFEALDGRALPVVAHHGDYAPSNVFVTEGRVEVVGFDDSRDGLPLEDVAHFILHLRFATRYHAGLSRAFLDGYGGVGEDELKLFMLARALQLLARGSATNAALMQKRSHRNVLRRAIVEALV